jgi:hypothetical protein
VARVTIYNTKAAAQYDSLRIGTTAGNAGTSTEPFLDLDWGCAWDVDCNGLTDIFITSSIAGHVFLIEAIIGA